ncbi:dethiobiotin synthase [Streptomyces sp. CB01881]|uniref:dethiobiotin synthase n=1 Tax=Streptomyces sp. CB01881 TaxID=2078691 RepID=UPI000CDC8343|nr:dethiobiotin synthase [Streptomyces sp. CB01881]AUY52555.1 dethiobiotin synthase [Streptomyces sp. CB01881]TYC70272.1 ATP-dependent dethiobiotin synthetase BioD [Streptomyces sp. CB01881]
MIAPPVLFVTGTGTEVGKTVTTAAVASAALQAGLRVAVLKPGQTGVEPGEPGDVEEVARLVGAPLAGRLTLRELVRYPEPLAPDTAARRSGRPYLAPADTAAAAAELAHDHDLVLVEGAGGLLVRYDDEGRTLADQALAARDLGLPAQLLLVATAGLGTLNTTSLTAEALAARGLPLFGVVIGAWPGSPGLADRCNLADLPRSAGAPLLGALPERAAAAGDFAAVARASLAPALHGRWDAAEFARTHQAAG